jgi:short-subunit dehydrogenase
LQGRSHALYFVTGHFAPKMAAAGGGSIINVSSTAAALGIPGLSVYGATKAALDALTRARTAEFAESNVRIKLRCPGADAELQDDFDVGP